MKPSQYARVFELEETYWWHVGLREYLRQCLKNLEGTGKRLVDIGCGSGMVLANLKSDWTNATGLDFSKLALPLCKKRSLNQLCQASGLHLPFQSDSIHVALSFHVLCHQGILSDFQAAREIWRTLRPMGWFIIELPAYEFLRSPHDEIALTRHRYSLGEVIQLLKNSGFHVRWCTYRNALSFLPAAALRLFKKRWRRESGTDLVALPNWLNQLLLQTSRLESRLLRSKRPLPFGLAIFAMAQKV